MIKVTYKKDFVQLNWNTVEVLIPIELYKTFTDNLYFVQKQNKWVKNEYVDVELEEKCTIEELSWFDFNLIYQKHIPDYSDKDRKYVNIKRLLKSCEWIGKKENFTRAKMNGPMKK